MATHRFAPRVTWNTMGAHPPVLRIADGDRVVAETLDAHGFDKAGKQRGADPNPMTGPFFVEGAEPGDAMEVTIERIEMNRPQGWTRQGLAWHVVDPAAVRSMPERDKVFWRIDRNAQTVALERPPAGLVRWTTPLQPMIGCLGVAPADGEAISTATSGPHGGNMDYRGVCEGVRLLFPVGAPGALFFLGDVHAAQGDGEIAGTGVEISAEVTFRVRIVKGRRIGWPRGETDTQIFAIGNARPLEQALQHATTEMIAMLEEDYGLDKLAASHVLGMAVRYDVANVFNPAFSVACRLEKAALAVKDRLG